MDSEQMSIIIFACTIAKYDSTYFQDSFGKWRVTLLDSVINFLQLHSKVDMQRIACTRAAICPTWTAKKAKKSYISSFIST